MGLDWHYIRAILVVARRGCFVAYKTEWLLLRNSRKNAPFQPLSVIARDPLFCGGPKRSPETERLLRPLQNDGGLAMTVGFPSVTEREISSKGDLVQC